jgi:hypothetical protein
MLLGKGRGAAAKTNLISQILLAKDRLSPTTKREFLQMLLQKVEASKSTFCKKWTDANVMGIDTDMDTPKEHRIYSSFRKNFGYITLRYSTYKNTYSI